MLSLRLLLIIAGLAAPFATWGAMAVKQKIVVNAAIEGERKASDLRCEVKVRQLEASWNAQIDDFVRNANSAADQINEPTDDKELQAICKRSASCRDRG